MKHNTKNTNTSRTYINNVPIRHGEVTVVTSDNATATMQHSSRLAKNTQKAGVPVLLINCGMSDKRFREYFYAEHDTPSNKKGVYLMSSVRGDLIGERGDVEQIVFEAGIGVIIIAGWEWTSSSWRRKQRLLFYLRELMAEQDVAIIIYSHVSNAPVAGEIDHGGLGKLSLLAMFIVVLEVSEELETVAPKPPAIVYNTMEEYEAAERSALVLINKINNFEEVKAEVQDPEPDAPDMSVIPNGDPPRRTM
jgi:hypothetical protein